MSTFLKITGSALVAASVGYALYTAKANERVETLADEMEDVVETVDHLKARINKKAVPKKEAANA